MKNFIKKRKFWIIAVVAFLAGAGYFYFGRDTEPKFDLINVSRGNVFQEVSVTGNVKPAENVDLAFEKSGKVSMVYVGVGDNVVSGQVLVRLDDSEIYAQLVGARANLKTQEAKFDELVRGSRPEEIAVSQIKVDNAQIILDGTKRVLVEKIKTSYTNSDDAVRNKADSFFKTPAIPAPQLNFYVADSQLKIDTESQRLAMEELLNKWNLSLSKISVNSDLSVYISEAKNNLNLVSAFLDKANSALNTLSAGSSVSQTTIDGWKAGISTARASINTAIDSVSTAETNYKNAQADLVLAQQQLNLEKAGSTSEEISAQEAQVEKYRADVLNYETQLEKTVIRAPISGVITKQSAKMGEIIAANTITISIISANQFEIESNIPEADIAKIKIDDMAKTTLDAYGDDVVFDVRVIKIDPAETIIEGVATYKTTFQFEKDDSRIKSGMTANIDISTDKRENVLVIPQRAVVARGAEKIVFTYNNAKKLLEERKVEIGLRGLDGNVEVLSGLDEGEKISAIGEVK